MADHAPPPLPLPPPGDHAGAGPPPPGGSHPAPATLHLIPPPADLAPMVEYLWQIELPAGSPDACWRVVVDGYVDLSVRLPVDATLLAAAARAADDRRACGEVVEALAASRTVVCGSATTARTLPLGDPMLLTGVRFRLGRASDVLRSSAGELVDGVRGLHEVLVGRTAADLARPIPLAAAPGLAAGAVARETAHALAAGACGAASRAPAADPAPAHAAAALRTFAREGVLGLARRLVARMPARPGDEGALVRLRQALRLLDRAGDGLAEPTDELDAAAAARVRDVTRALAVSHRTLERLFAEQLGYAPRTYLRLRRVGAVAEALEREAWAGAAPAAAEPLAPVAGPASRLVLGPHDPPTPGAPVGLSDAAVAPAPTRAAPPSREAARERARERAREVGRAGARAGWRGRPRVATLAELAHRIGYSDHAHMSREFSRVMGTSPSAYRRDARETPLVRRFGPVHLERTIPWGGIGRTAGAAP